MQSSVKILSLLCIIMLLAGCHTKRAVSQSSTPLEEEIQQPAWHTSIIQNARATVNLDGRTYQTNCSMWAVYDSLTILSVTPMLGIEMFRAEVTPTEVVIIDKINKRCLRTTYDEINRYVTPEVHYRDFQTLAAGEGLGPKKNEALIRYSALGKTVSMRLEYPNPMTDIPVSTRRLNTTNYQHITLDNLLQ